MERSIAHTAKETRIDRRSAIIAGLTTLGALGGVVVTQRFRTEASSRNLEPLGLTEPLIETPNLKLIRSPVKKGIIDIHTPDSDLRIDSIVNNFILLVGWKNEQGKLNYYLAEIEEVPIQAYRDASNSSTLLLYHFDKVAMNHHPNLTVEMDISSDKSGDVVLSCRTVDNPNNLRGIRLALGCFYGIKHGTMEVLVTENDGEFAVKPWEPEFPTLNWLIGDFREVSNRARGFKLKSVFDNMPDVSLHLAQASPLQEMFTPRQTIAGLLVETRNNPWDPSQNILHRELTQTTGRKEWLEASILFPQDRTPSYRLSLSHKTAKIISD